jgi:hypothetical protein
MRRESAVVVDVLVDSVVELVTAPCICLDHNVTAGMAAAESDCVISIERVGIVDVQSGFGRRPSSGQPA